MDDDMLPADPEAEAAAEQEYDSLVANPAEAEAIADAHSRQGLVLLPAAQWDRVYKRLVAEQRLSAGEAWRVAKGATSYQHALERLRRVRGAEAAAAQEVALMAPAVLEVVYSPDVFPIILGLMTPATLCTAEATCKLWQRRVGPLGVNEWAVRLDALSQGNHDAPAKLRKWGTWEGEVALTSIGPGVSAKNALLSLSVMNKPVVRTPPRLTAEDVAVAVTVFVETPSTKEVPIDRADPATFLTRIVCSDILPVTTSLPIGETWEAWAGGQQMTNPQPTGLQWPVKVDTQGLLMLPPAAPLPNGAAALGRAIRGVYSSAYAFDQSPAKSFAVSANSSKGGEGAKRGAMAFISVRAVRRSDNKVVPLLDTAPLLLSYGGGQQEDSLEFENQQLVQQYLTALPRDNCETMVGPYDAADFPMQQLKVRADVFPESTAGAGLRWQLALQFYLGPIQGADLTEHEGAVAAPCEDMLKLLSSANWQG